ncbi:unnamed protein product, partial [Urochloa humidicola]
DDFLGRFRSAPRAEEKRGQWEPPPTSLVFTSLRTAGAGISGQGAAEFRLAQALEQQAASADVRALAAFRSSM